MDFNIVGAKKELCPGCYVSTGRAYSQTTAFRNGFQEEVIQAESYILSRISKTKKVGRALQS